MPKKPFYRAFDDWWYAQVRVGIKRVQKNLSKARRMKPTPIERSAESADGRDSVVHYVRDPKTGELMDFKFTKHSHDTPTLFEQCIK
jgi:hypothetical protein